MSEATVSTELFESLFLEGKKSQLSEEANAFSTRTLVWLALPPFWQLSLAKQGFPQNETEFITGDEVRALLDAAVKANFSDTDITNRADDSGSYWMTPLQRRSLIEQITSGVLFTGNLTGLYYLQKETAEIGRHLLELHNENELPPILWRWASLAEQADSLYALSDFFGYQVENALRAARDAAQTAAPEVLRWLEAFAPFVEIYGSSLEVALTSARREYEIFNRQAYDQRYLSSYLVRAEQDNALLDLLSQPDEENAPWALHYVGAGGVGKTMLMRHINAHLSPQYNLAIARIDFDYLNPDYPAKQPGLLLLGFAVELKKYLGKSEGFLRFEKQVLELHQALQSASTPDDYVNVRAGQWTYIIRAFVDECMALSQMGKRPLLILDTCEELVKLRPDGKLPQSVRVTFDILEEIHRLMPSVRVIFSGRRPLAAVGCNWRLSGDDAYLSKLPKRDYLMLQEIRGFNRDEAIAFLSEYKKGKVPKNLFEAILTRSRNVLIEKARPFQRGDNEKAERSDIQATTERDIRYNPFDLDLYAAWTVSEPDLDEKKLIAGAHFYVKERIVGRVNSQLKNLLPTLLLLGRFDEDMLRELYGEDKKDFNLLFEELIDQEWIDTERGVSAFEAAIETDDVIETNGSRSLSVRAIDPHMRERLLAYYRAERFSELSAALERVAPLLSEITLERDWRELSISYFEAAAQVLTELNKKLAFDWWEKVEAKLAETARWDWAYALTSQLLARGGVAELKDEVSEHSRETENILRPAILATYAAALTHIKPQELKNVWREVRAKAHLHPTDSGKSWLSKRAVCGMFAADIADSKETTNEDFEKLINEFERELLFSGEAKTDTYSVLQLQASIFAVVEKIVERCERLFGEFQEPFNLFNLKQDVFFWTNDIPDELSIFYAMLKARLNKLSSGLYPFENEFNRVSDTKNLEHKQKWLDWRAPDDFYSRRKLEYLRGVYPFSESPEAALEEVGNPPESFHTIDAERLASAVLTLKGHAGLNTDFEIDEEKFHASLSLAKKISADSQSFNEAFFVNAHRAFPPYFIVALETQALNGKLSASVKRAVSISQEAEINKNFIIRQETERLLARLAFHFRLRNERSVSFGESLTSSEELEDVKLRSMLDSLDGGILEQSYWRNLAVKADKRKQAALLHFRYRSSAKLLNPKIIEIAKSNDKEKSQPQFIFRPESPLRANIFESLIVYDDIEYNLRKEKKTSLPPSRLSALSKLAPTDFAFHTLLGSINEEVPLKVDRGIESLNLNNLLSSEKRPSEERIKLVGARRAAAIMLEEGTLLTIRNPGAALPILRRASEVYKECKDTCGEFLTELTIAILAIKINEHIHLGRALRDLEPIYNELIKSESSLPAWTDLVLCVDLAEKNRNPAKIFADFFDKYADDFYWRPILARLVYCLVREKECAGKGILTLIIKTWLRENYARAADDDQPSFLAEFNFGEQNAGNSEQKTVYWSHFRKYLPYVFFAGLIISCLYLVRDKYVGIIEHYLLLIREYLVGVDPILSIWLIIGITSCYTVLDLWLRHFKLNIFIIPTQIPSNLNLPLSVAHNIKWQKNKVIQRLFSFVFKETQKIDQSLDNSYSSLPAIFNKSARAFLTTAKFRIGLLPTTLIFENMNSVAAPWEAALGLGAKDFHKTRFMFRRMLQKAYTPRTGEMLSPIGICNWAADNALLNSVYNGWSSLAELDNFQYSGFIPSNIKKAQNNKNVCILHLLGLPIETPSGMRLEIVASETESREIFNTTDVSDKQEERIVSVEKINQEFPNLRVCIVQLPPRLEEPRSLTNRIEMAKLRRFCAEVFQSGVGAVILLPPVSSELSIDCVQKLAEFIAKTGRKKNEFSGWIDKKFKSNIRFNVFILLILLCCCTLIGLLITTVYVIFFLGKSNANVEDWMRAIYNIQKLIASQGHSNKEAALEMAFDVCLYLHDEFSWQTHKWEFNEITGN
jgi:hypothetical protein